MWIQISSNLYVIVERLVSTKCMSMSLYYRTLAFGWSKDFMYPAWHNPLEIIVAYSMCNPRTSLCDYVNSCAFVNMTNDRPRDGIYSARCKYTIQFLFPNGSVSRYFDETSTIYIRFGSDIIYGFRTLSFLSSSGIIPSLQLSMSRWWLKVRFRPAMYPCNPLSTLLWRRSGLNDYSPYAAWYRCRTNLYILYIL